MLLPPFISNLSLQNLVRSRLHIFRMSTKAYILPLNAQSNPAPVAGINASELLGRVPHGSKPHKVGQTHVFFETTNVTAITSLGEKFDAQDGNAKREILRKAVGNAVKELRAFDGLEEVHVDASTDPHAAAVAANLALYQFTLKTNPPSRYEPGSPAQGDKLKFVPLEPSKDWNRGETVAYAQNLARTLMELPANMMTPTIFTERVKAEFANVPNVKIIVRDEEWAAEMGMRTFLSVAAGTSEPAKFLEIHYSGSAQEDQSMVFVGKGITFDSGGISLKPGAGMKAMRGDMGGAATVVSAALAIAKLQLPVNLITLTPLTENMPGPSATKPGDIIYAMNGKSVEVDNTDAEGRLVLSDALYYASKTFKPHTVIDVATLTGAAIIALGEVFSAVYSTDDALWTELHAAGEREYDRFWRMPLDEDYGPQIYSSNADLCNTGGRPAGSSTAALFLKSFVDGIKPEGDVPAAVRWAHIDIAGSMEATRPTPYQDKGMTGRPVRALVEFVRQQSLGHAA